MYSRADIEPPPSSSGDATDPKSLFPFLMATIFVGVAMVLMESLKGSQVILWTSRGDRIEPLSSWNAVPFWAAYLVLMLLYFTLLGELYKDVDDDKALQNFRKAILLAKTQSDQRTIQKKIDLLTRQKPGGNA